ncbi:BglG family transcription antiterminator [Enterococcus casseliflavus]|uniref:BglG family transcription antiterminator n=1 Tax=Enterococcus casseliflavus TaxID=37734 RepID=UPI0022E2150B|nr:BglG family transcription antiterminator [Enterococcus casseliflavus]
MIHFKLTYLFSEPNVEAFLDLTKWRDEDFLAEIAKINQITEQRLNQRIMIHEGEVLIPSLIQRKWPEILFDVQKNTLFFSEEERRSMIYLLTFSAVKDLSVYQFQELFYVSKNTILKDVKGIREELAAFKIQLLYSRKYGFYLEGEEYQIRALAFRKVSTLSNTKNGNLLLFEGIYEQDKTIYVQIRDRLSATLTDFNLVIVPSRFEEMLYFLNYLSFRMAETAVSLAETEIPLLQSLHVHQVSQQFLAEFPDIKNRKTEELYVTILLKTILQGDIEDTSLEFLLECASKIIHEMERLAAIEFVDYRTLLMNTFYHLVPAYFRIRYGFPLENVLIEEIKLQYNELFELTRRALGSLEDLVGTIPDEEIGYFTILFGGEISKQKAKCDYFQLNALVVCPSGISSSLILESELKELFPQIHFLPARSIEEYENIRFNEEIDLIFSSAPIKTKRPCYVINPIMTPIEKDELVKNVQAAFFPSKTGLHSIDDVLEVILPYVDLKAGISKQKLRKILQRKINRELNRREDQRPMLSDLLTAETIQFTEVPLTWQEAIREAAAPLKKTNKIEEQYITAMINKVVDHGPFIHIGKGIALPHARPEDGVNAIGMSLLKVKEPVLLNDDPQHPIHVFICLAAVDNELHLKALASLTKILSNNEKLTALLSATNADQIIEVIREGEDEK